MDEEGKKAKDRSPSFPFISLSTALGRVEQFYAEEKRGFAPIRRAALHWKYSPTSSGLTQTVSALKNYGLLVDEGSGEMRRVRLTDLALRIVLDVRPNSEERVEHLRRAALSPVVAAEAHSSWGDSLPGRDTLYHYLVFDRGFSPDSARKTAEIIFENQRLIKDHESSSASGPVETYPDSSAVPSGSASFSGHAPTPLIQAPAPTQPSIESSQSLARHVEQLLGPDGVVIRIEYGATPTAATYDFIKDYVELRLKSLRPPPQAIAAQPAVQASAEQPDSPLVVAARA